MENKPIPFKAHLETMGGSGVIYEPECRTILHQWKTADWIKVDEYIAPIVSQLLTDAAETNRPMYEKIMAAVMEVYPELKRELGYIPTLKRIK